VRDGRSASFRLAGRQAQSLNGLARGETAKRQALAIGYLAKIASIRFERLVDWLIGFGSAGNDFREGLLIHVLGLTWAMAGLYASYYAMVRPNSAICVCVERCVSLGSGSGRRGLAPGSPSVVFDLCYVIQQ
jgi:hypothetical protein